MCLSLSTCIYIDKAIGVLNEKKITYILHDLHNK